jgi:phosphoribosylamine--glycine ligase
MGSYSPAPFMDDNIYNETMNQIIDPTLSALKDSAISFTGFLYAGLIIEHETHQPYVLEFNVRMGDPECQSIIPRMESDLVEYLVAATDGNLSCMPPIRWTKNHAVSVVMTSKGYPGTYETGKTINGLKIHNSENVYIFHSGTVRDSEGKYITSGGRVLSVTALARDIKSAIARAYSVVRTIHWGQNEEYYRNDIGYKALKTNRI